MLANDLVKEQDKHTFYQNIKKESERLLILINNIILLSKLDEKVSEEKTEIDLYSVAQEVIDELTVLANNKNVAMSIKGGPTTVKSIKQCVYEIVYNLCENAIVYNKENGSVVIEINKEDDKVSLSVIDSGVGIPSSQQSRIFERFYRIDKSHSKKTGGTGLGLSIVKHAADNIAATIKVESVESKGSKFTVTFH